MSKVVQQYNRKWREVMNKVRRDIKNIGRVEWNSIELRMQEQSQVVTAIQQQESYCHSK